MLGGDFVVFVFCGANIVGGGAELLGVGEGKYYVGGLRNLGGVGSVWRVLK